MLNCERLANDEFVFVNSKRVICGDDCVSLSPPVIPRKIGQKLTSPFPTSVNVPSVLTPSLPMPISKSSLRATSPTLPPELVELFPPRLRKLSLGTYSTNFGGSSVDRAASPEIHSQKEEDEDGTSLSQLDYYNYDYLNDLVTSDAVKVLANVASPVPSCARAIATSITQSYVPSGHVSFRSYESSGRDTPKSNISDDTTNSLNCSIMKSYMGNNNVKKELKVYGINPLRDTKSRPMTRVTSRAHGDNVNPNLFVRPSPKNDLSSPPTIHEHGITEYTNNLNHDITTSVKGISSFRNCSSVVETKGCLPDDINACKTDNAVYRSYQIRKGTSNHSRQDSASGLNRNILFAENRNDNFKIDQDVTFHRNSQFQSIDNSKRNKYINSNFGNENGSSSKDSSFDKSIKGYFPLSSISPVASERNFNRFPTSYLSPHPSLPSRGNSAASQLSTSLSWCSHEEGARPLVYKCNETHNVNCPLMTKMKRSTVSQVRINKSDMKTYCPLDRRSPSGASFSSHNKTRTEGIYDNCYVSCDKYNSKRENTPSRGNCSKLGFTKNSLLGTSDMKMFTEYTDTNSSLSSRPFMTRKQSTSPSFPVHSIMNPDNLLQPSMLPTPPGRKRSASPWRRDPASCFSSKSEIMTQEHFPMGKDEPNRTVNRSNRSRSEHHQNKENATCHSQLKPSFTNRSSKTLYQSDCGRLNSSLSSASQCSIDHNSHQFTSVTFEKQNLKDWNKSRLYRCMINWLK